MHGTLAKMTETYCLNVHRFAWGYGNLHRFAWGYGNLAPKFTSTLFYFAHLLQWQKNTLIKKLF